MTDETRSPVLRAREAVLATPWAMTVEWVEVVAAIAGREHEPLPEALEAYRARAVPGGDRLLVRDGVGILTARGPMFRYANLFTAISGATSYQSLRLDLAKAVDERDVRAILVNVDSPGGEFNGIAELARAIEAARKVKPIAAYVGGTGASAGYWLAAPTGEVVIGEAGIVGSIGVVMALPAKKDDGRIEIVSSQSPNKRPDVATDEGRATLQRTVDALGQVFVDAVAEFRGVDADAVVTRFGGGGLEVGAAAVAAGMADRVGDFESLLADLSSRGARRITGGFRMSEQTIQPGPDAGIPKAAHDAAVAAARAEGEKAGAVAGAKVERDRLKAILALDEAKGREAQALAIATDTDLGAEAAKAVLAAAPTAAAGGQPRAKDTALGLVTDQPPGNGGSASSWGDVVTANNKSRGFA